MSKDRIDIRNQQSSGLITLSLGVMVFAFGIGGSLMIGVHALVEIHSQTHAIGLLFIPQLIGGGAALAIAGLFIYRGSEVARIIAQVVSIGAYLWGGAFVVSGCQAAQANDASRLFSESTLFAVWLVVILLSLIILWSVPTFILYILHHSSKEVRRSSHS